jgi:hypothetical protein
VRLTGSATGAISLTVAFERIRDGGDFHLHLFTHRDAIQNRFRQIGFEAKRGRRFDFEQRLARHGEIAHIGELARDDAIKGRGDFGVARTSFRPRSRCGRRF